jgi:hypothetical protein
MFQLIEFKPDRSTLGPIYKEFFPIMTGPYWFRRFIPETNKWEIYKRSQQEIDDFVNNF